MLSPLHKALFAAVTLSGCFAAQALFIDAQDSANAAQIEQLTSSLALCPELSASVAAALDEHHGLLPHSVTQQLTDETRQCERQRRNLPDTARGQLAYAALAALAHEQTTNVQTSATDNTGRVELQLKLSTQLRH